METEPQQMVHLYAYLEHCKKNEFLERRKKTGSIWKIKGLNTFDVSTARQWGNVPQILGEIISNLEFYTQTSY